MEKITWWDCVIKPSLIFMGIGMLIMLPFVFLFSNIHVDNYHVNYRVIGIRLPINGYCEYVLYGTYETTIVDTIGKYHVGDIIKIN